MSSYPSIDGVFAVGDPARAFCNGAVYGVPMSLAHMNNLQIGLKAKHFKCPRGSPLITDDPVLKKLRLDIYLAEARTM
jgi:hypothetical protein